MRNSDRDALDKTVMELANRYGSITINAVSQRLGKKWETVQSAVNRLVTKGLLYYVSETKNPKIYSVWPNEGVKRTRADYLASVENGNGSPVSNDGYARPTIPYRRALSPSEVAPIVGFVCHPAVDRRVLPPAFLRCHWAGAWTVDVSTKGATYETYALKDEGITGGWVVRPMSGNLSLHGHVNLPDDPDQYTITGITHKDGHLGKINIRVHSRYIFYKSADQTAIAEFRAQVNDVLAVLKKQGWAFGEIHYNNNQLHRALNSVAFASALPVGHEDKPTDMVHFDRSHGTPEGEVYGVGEDANETSEFLADPMSAINAINARLDSLVLLVDKLAHVSEKMTSSLTHVVETQAQIAIPFDNGGGMYV